MGTVHGICPWGTALVMRKFDGGAFWVGCGWFFFGTLVGGGRGRGRDNARARKTGSFSLDDTHCQTTPFFMLSVID